MQFTFSDFADPTSYPFQWVMSGSIASWAFYSLTGHQKPTLPEQIYQALIFIGLIQACVLLVRNTLLLLGKIYSIATWTREVEFLWVIFLGLAVGFLISWAANKDLPHRWLRYWRITKRHSFPSVWYSYFNCEDNNAHAILNLRDSRRLYGHIDEWADDPNTSHVIVSDADWLNDDGSITPCDGVQRMLVSTADISFVQIMSPNPEVPPDSANQILRKQQPRQRRKRAIIHLTDSPIGAKQIRGFINEMPDLDKASQLIVAKAEWLADDGNKLENSCVQTVLIRSDDVSMIEYTKSTRDGTTDVSKRGSKGASSKPTKGRQGHESASSATETSPNVRPTEDDEIESSEDV